MTTPGRPPQSISDAVQSMTMDQAKAALFVTDSLLEQTCGCELHKATGEGRLVPYEKDLVELLLTQWGSATKAATDKAVRLILANHGEFSIEEANSIVAAIAVELKASLVPGVKHSMPPIIQSGYELARTTAATKLEHSMTWSAADKTAVDWLSNHHLYWVGTYFDKNLSDKLCTSVLQGMQEGLGREAIGNRLADFFNSYPGVSAKPDAYWRGLAANGMNRSRNFGILQTFEDVQVQMMQVVAVMDERTTPICRRMNGQLIPVSAAISQRNRLMAAGDPEDVKTIAPFVTAKAIEGMDVSQIVAAGVIMPPYHFNCRTTVIAVLQVGKSLKFVRIDI